MPEDLKTTDDSSQNELLSVACAAVAFLCDKDPELVEPDEDGKVVFAGESAAIIINVDSDPPALVFMTYLLENVDETPALYALVNDINADIRIGQLYYNLETREIRYYYCYPVINPVIEIVANILAQMLENADLYDDRLKTRLGGDRFLESDEDEVEV